MPSCWLAHRGVSNLRGLLGCYEETWALAKGLGLICGACEVAELINMAGFTIHLASSSPILSSTMDG